MFSIKFYNEAGSVTFSGGGSYSAWRLTAAEGLAFCGKTFRTVKYTEQEGQETTSAVSNPRTITLSGDVYVTDNEEYTKALCTFEHEGTLEITTNMGRRIIKARCSEFQQGDIKGKYHLFTVQFICDKPYFEDADKIERPIFKEIPLLDKDFTYPGAFSKRISRTNLQYDGTASCEPVIFIEVKEGAQGDNVLEIINHSSGESLKFDYGAVMGESITVDVENRKIYTSGGVSLLEYLSDDSFFDGFRLYPGINDIEVINRNMNTGLTVSCTYANKYIEAVCI